MPVHVFLWVGEPVLKSWYILFLQIYHIDTLYDSGAADSEISTLRIAVSHETKVTSYECILEWFMNTYHIQ